MPATFDGDTLTITLSSHGGSGVSNIDVEMDLYSDWKEWVLALPQRQGLPPAFRTIGGDALTPGLDAGSYFFIRNDLGWRIRPFEEDGSYFAIGNLVPQDSTLPILIPTIGAYRVLVAGLQPITQGISDLLSTAVGTSGEDWTIVERKQIRDAVGIDGDKKVARGGQLQKKSEYPNNDAVDSTELNHV